VSDCALQSVGVVCALGSGVSEVLARVVNGDATGLVARADLVRDRELLFGAV
jgi:hypothetical protein